MNREQLNLLIENKLDKKEAEELLSSLEAYPEMLNDYFREDWETTNKDGAIVGGEKILHEIRNRIAIEEKLQVKKLNGHKFFKYAIAASIITLFVSLGVHYSLNVGNKPRQVSQIQAKNKEWLTVTNFEEKIKEVTLSDGSLIMLEKNGVIQYSNVYDSLDRNIWLTGKAYFEVTKNEQIPFVVNTESLSTTALGTSFTINNYHGEILVQLHTGVVAIAYPGLPDNDFLKLQPGDSFEYNVEHKIGVKKNRITEKQTKHQKEKEIKRRSTIEKITDGSIQFDNAPLKEVLELLSDKFDNNIEYESADLQDKFFTGTVLATDSAENILNIIVQMNGLVIIKTESGYLMKK